MGDSPTDTVGCANNTCCRDTQTELAERVAAIDVAVGPDVINQNGQGTVDGNKDGYSKDVVNSQRNGVDAGSGTSEELDGAHDLPAPKRASTRPTLSGRKYSLQERPSGNYLTSADSANFGPYATGPSTHISPRIVRRPTIESHRVSISDAVVGSFQFLMVVSRV